MQIHQIKPAQISDIPTIIKLAESIWRPTYASILSEEQIIYMFKHIYSEASIKAQMQQEKHQFLILYLQDEPVGFASFSEKDKHIFKLHKLYVLHDVHGKGMGRLLLQRVEQLASEQGGRVLELNVNRENPAKSFYEKVGFSVYQEVDIPIGPYWMNDYIMRKNL